MRLRHDPSPLGSGREGPSDKTDSIGHGLFSQGRDGNFIEHKTQYQNTLTYKACSDRLVFDWARSILSIPSQMYPIRRVWQAFSGRSSGQGGLAEVLRRVIDTTRRRQVLRKGGVA
jgi:hypothetical protein